MIMTAVNIYGGDESPSIPITATSTVLPDAQPETQAAIEVEVKEEVESHDEPEALTETAPPAELATASEPPAPTGQGEPAPSIPSDTVQVTIIGSAQTGTILSTELVELDGPATALDVLKKVVKARNIPMEYRGTGAAAYVQGINDLYEFDEGAGSGWMYSVNDKFPSRSAGAWSVKPGDHIQWLYTTNLGKDLGVGQDVGLWDGDD
jgi:hypothetical protein